MFAGVVHTVKCIFKKHDIDLISFGVDTATRDGKKIANEIADYLSNAGYNVSIDSGDNRASLKIDLSNAKYLKED